MARILCSYSGLQFNCEHMPMRLTGGETAHPTFFLPQKKLAGLYSLYLDAKLTTEEQWLLLLAYLKSTELVHFKVPAQFGPQTPALIAKHLDDLVATALNLAAMRGDKFQPAHVAITPQTATLENLPHWIELWKQTYNNYLQGFDDRDKLDQLADIEVRLQRLQGTRSAQADARYNSLLADWASRAFEFPDFLIEDNGRTTTLSSYWKLIIRSCQNSERIFQFPRDDIQELYDHCCERADNLPLWGITVLGIIREGLENHNSFLGLGDIDLAGKPISYQLLDGTAAEANTVQQANLAAIINIAPTAPPVRADYPTEFAFLRARLNYQLAAKKSAAASATPVVSTPRNGEL